MRALWVTGRTFAPVRVAHIVGGAVGVVVWVGSGSIYSNELAPVHLRHKAEDERNRCREMRSAAAAACQSCLYLFQCF